MRFIFSKHHFIYTQNLQHPPPPTHPIGYWISSQVLLMEAHPMTASTSYYHFTLYSSLQSFAVAREVYTSFLETMALCMHIPQWDGSTSLFYLCKSYFSPNFLFHSKVTFLAIQHCVHPWVTSALLLKETSWHARKSTCSETKQYMHYIKHGL